jgi:hypothetical protein
MRANPLMRPALPRTSPAPDTTMTLTFLGCSLSGGPVAQPDAGDGTKLRG